ncbi:MAG: 2-amino-4-hydroxy-6-hydroxymethyldihydropteridine diphosphokinase [Cyanobacteria bacterium HKST-UBA06]|nr:2-amino-4-hydroxy-6-hydroxymethyldihydropteridine diphosphokinase [Cyanobacteria bacterium HKST-UBA06]
MMASSGCQHRATDCPGDWVDVYIGAGSNLGQRSEQLHRAWHALCRLLDTAGVAMAPFIETPAIGPPQPMFLNTVFHLKTRLSPALLLQACQQLEWRAGRRGWRYPIAWTPRPLDLDVLLYADWVIEEAGLCVPHPGLATRPFVRQPLKALGVSVKSLPMQSVPRPEVVQV